MQDPKIVVSAVLDSEKKITENVKVYPCTIRRYALLEKLDSPFLNPEIKFDVNSIIPSAYVFSTDNENLKKYTTANIDKLTSDAFEWADSLSLSDIPEMIKIITKQFADLNTAAPDAVPTKKN